MLLRLLLAFGLCATCLVATASASSPVKNGLFIEKNQVVSYVNGKRIVLTTKGTVHFADFAAWTGSCVWKNPDYRFVSYEIIEPSNARYVFVNRQGGNCSDEYGALSELSEAFVYDRKYPNRLYSLTKYLAKYPGLDVVQVPFHTVDDSGIHVQVPVGWDICGSTRRIRLRADDGECFLQKDIAEKDIPEKFHASVVYIDGRSFLDVKIDLKKFFTKNF